MMNRNMKNCGSRKDDWKKSFRNLRVVGVREWMGVMMLMMVPVLNIVMLVRWAVADVEAVPASKVYWARATLLVLGAVMMSAALLSAFLYWGAMIHI